MAIVVPEKMYVGFQLRKERNWNEAEPEEITTLGFATYVEDNKKFEKRKGTIDSWAGSHYWTKDEDKPTKESEIMPNTLLEGYKLSKDVRHGYGWGTGNVVWRVEDPRGFELEISSANMASILGCTTIIEGVIQGKCIWGWNLVGGSRVTLLPENSEPYQEALKDTKRRNKKALTVKDINIGDKVGLKNGTEGVWLGKLYYLTTQYGQGSYKGRGGNHYYPSRAYHWTGVEKPTHFFLLDSGVIYTMKTPKFVEVIEKVETPLTPQQGADEINVYLRNRFRIETPGNDDSPVLVDIEKIKMENVKAQFLPIAPDDALHLITENDYNSDTMTWHRFPVVLSDECGRVYCDSGRGYWGTRDFIEFDEIHYKDLIDELLFETVATLQPRKATMGYSWQSRTQDYKINKIEVKLTEFDKFGNYIFVLNYNKQSFIPGI